VKRPAGWIVLVALWLAPVAHLGAQQTQPPPEQPPKNQPPPLFPKHRRGFYLNSSNIEVIDATPQSPPLAIDDPGVPDKGEFEVNLLTNADLTADTRTVDMFRADVNYGMILKGWGSELPAQLKLEIPIVAHRDSGSAYQMGLGDSELGLKLNFYNDENRGTRVSVYPQLEFSTAGSVEKGVAEAGQTLELPLLISQETRYVTLVGNAGLNKPFHAEGRSTELELGAGVGRAFLRKLAVMGDITSLSSLDFGKDRLISADAGFIYGVRKAIWYARVGHTIFSDDGHHAFISVGMKLLVDTASKK
jgi:hypothetical protein